MHMSSMSMSALTSSNNGGISSGSSSSSNGNGGYWRSSTSGGGNHHSPLSANSSSSSLSSGSGSSVGAGGTTVHVKNYAGNGLLSPVTHNNISTSARYQSPYYSTSSVQHQQQQQPSPLPRAINATTTATNSSSSTYNNNGSSGGTHKYINNSAMNPTGTGTAATTGSARSVGLYSSSYDEQRAGGGISKSLYNNNSNSSSNGSGLRKVNHASSSSTSSSSSSSASASSNEISVTVNNTSSSSSIASASAAGSKYYSNHSNGIVSATSGGGGNYYNPGTERDKYSHNSSSSSSSSSSGGGGVSVLVGRSSSYSQINTIGTNNRSNNNSSTTNTNGYNNYYSNNNRSSNGNGLSHQHHHQDQQQQQQYHQYQSQQHQNQNNSRYNSQPQPQPLHQQQRTRMSNGNGNGMSQGNTNTSLNGTVAVAVVSRSQSQLLQSSSSSSSSSSQSKQSETSSNNYNGISTSNGSGNRYGGGGSVLLGGGSLSNNNSRQIAIGQSSEHHHRPAQRTSSHPMNSSGSGSCSSGSGTNGITIGDSSASAFALAGNCNKKVGLNGGSGSVTTMNNSNNSVLIRKKGILRKDVRKKKVSVTFPKEVCQIIGYGGDTTDDESDDEPVPDPLDSASVAELLEKNSTTPIEKELNRLTTKNTNFNSIKTNLLGYTSIEIGPIVGCMNGNSLTGPSKPLITIGTFEARGQPLKIKKVGAEYNNYSSSNSVNVNEERELRQQQQTQQKTNKQKQDEVKPAIVKVNGTTMPSTNGGSRMTASSTTATTSPTTKTNPSASATASPSPKSNNSSPSPNIIVPIPASRQSLTNRLDSSNKSTTTTLRSNSNANAPNLNTGKDNSTRSMSSSQTKATAAVNNDKSNDMTGNGTSATAAVAPAPVVAPVSSSVISVNQENNSELNSNPNPSAKNDSAAQIAQADDDDTYNAEPPPIPVSSAPSKNSTTISKPSTTTSSNNTSTPSSLTNLYILNDGNIASRRSTFLHDILSFDTPITLEVDNHNNHISGSDGGEDVSVGAQDSLDPPRVVKSEPKLDNSPTTTLLSESPITIPTSTDDSMNHFDDSLEDSGLDIKTITSKLQDTKRSLVETSSESDNEKSGSNSDSGTEQDFIERNRNRSNCNMSNVHDSTNSPTKDNNNSKDGLFISVDESCNSNRTLSSSKAAKLSPDSVLSEMSMASGESMNADDDDDDDDVPPLEVVPPINANGLLTSGPAIPPVLKRLAPPPPKPPQEQQLQEQCAHESIYTNTTEEELYDDVTHLHEKTEVGQEYTDEDIEESLYDDCSTLVGMSPPPPSCSSDKKGSVGSYDFTDASNNKSGLLDPDLHEKIPLKPDDGIEFIGIRKIDAESFLKEQSPSSSATESANGKKNRVGLGSPKPKRRVNQFFSTIGKRAGAAFSRTPLDFSSSSSGPKSPTLPPVDVAAASFAHFSKFKRSLSQDEANLTRTQEIYATLSPAMLKNKGLAPVLNKLSKLDFSTNVKDKDEDKLSRKNKFSTSLKKFLKFGSKESDGKYEFGSPGSQSGSDKSPTSPTKTGHEFGGLQPNRKSSSSNGLAESGDSGSNISNSPRHSSVSHLEEISTSHQGKYYVGPPLQHQNSKNYGSSGPCPARPPPPPPRVYSYDQLNASSYKGDQMNPRPYQQRQHSHQFNNQYNNNSNGQSGSGSVTSSHSHGPKPARPPPPVIRTNKVAPSFVSVFANPSAATGSSTSSASYENYYSNATNVSSQGQDNLYGDLEQDQPPQLPPPLNQRRPSTNFNAPLNNGNDTVRGNNPPNKPKRKASIYRPGETQDQGAFTANYLETTYNHITSLNFETLKLIASQTPVAIKRGVPLVQKFNKVSPLRWSQFYVTDVEPLTHGKGFCFYSAFWEDESCLLLVQESLSCGNPPLEFDCIESMASFEDIIPPQFISWKPSEFVNTNNGVKVFVSVLPSCTVQTLSNYLNSSNVSPSRKYFALLQSMDFWGRDDLSDLIVFHQMPSEGDSQISDYSCGSLASKSKHSSQQSPAFGLVYVVSARLKSGSLLSSQVSRGVFESAITKLLFNNNSYHHLLCDNDQSILYRRIVAPGIGSHEVEAQLRLFLQLKLFGAQGNDLDKILRYRSDKQVTQWMDKERAFCMKDAIERTLQRNSEPISPLRKSFVEFLMISDSCAKAVLDLIVDLHPDE